MFALLTYVTLSVLATPDGADAPTPAGAPVHLRAGDRVTLSAAGSTATTADVRWFVARPLARDYDNPAACPPPRPRAGDDCHDLVAYELVELAELAGRASFELAEVTALSRPGTHRLGAMTGAGRPFLDEPAVARLLEIVIRADDTYAGYLTELVGVPFVLMPREVAGVHQTDARLGADCVALVIYGRRRMGHRVRYVAPRALARALPPVRSARAGDVLHFGFQTAVLYRDLPPTGVVTGDDLIIHTFHGLAEIARLADVPYGRARHRVLRWPARGLP